MVDSLYGTEVEEPSIDIRASIAEDAAEVEELRVRCWQVDFSGILEAGFLSALDPSKSAEGRAAAVRAGKDSNLVAVSKGKIVGLSDSGIRRGSAADDKEGEVFSLYVATELRGKGVGRLLLERQKEALRDRGFTSLWISVLSANSPAVGFYEHVGGDRRGAKTTTIGGKDYEETLLRWSL